MQSKTGWAVLATLALITATLLSGVGLTAASLSTPTGHPGAGPFEGVTKYTSLNWAGYFAENTSPTINDTVTKVAGTWVQPSVNCGNDKTAIVVIWVGIDGAVSSTVEQTGSFAQCVKGTASYSLWWELYPKNSVQLISTITVHPGDTITGSVTFSSATGKFTMTVADGSKSFSKTGTQPGTERSSAECIVERPGGASTSNGLYSLADFGVATFSSCTATIAGHSGGIGSFPQVGAITMLGNNEVKVIAKTSGLTSQTDFSVTWKGYH